MNNLHLIIAIAAWLAVAVSTWGIIYFVGRIFTHYYFRSKLGDMPSREELLELYEKNNAIIQYREHSPTDEKLRS